MDLYDENPDLGDEIDRIIEMGDNLRHDKKYNEALSYYEKAWSLIPEPKTGWMMPTVWLVDSFFLYILMLINLKTLKSGGERLLLVSAEDDTRPFTRMGMLCFELKEHDVSFEYFHKAYILGNKRAFKEYPKKYLNFYLEETKKRN